MIRPDQNNTSENGNKNNSYCCSISLFHYETQKLLSVRNVPLSIFRLLFKIGIIYQLWWARGYQKYEPIETSVTIKVKGISK